ncbi:uncharacterized protein MONOS_6884 [Monocercomonoides exilis]|uniref:uncharacterized protein n=1 Tax=Monocercomonoides exilis TaxID=2049356 RepID=UPI00355AA227|nr:hypothetical protein MONOS_6884 [Monocercomonoides exilis]|eukprot:MONOS_6884.1-p1 / transcript=MONOS_6884.1 / gene=MONOS_6884 / organism=Monocercomonoides_exilis_PA203 / gene_product=unspecified product / transcript_product=unspecified product / location=Mono_scaffold00225:50537-50809(+) / protein_length=91 / sequence_SO=supercontig / SO=protein_coding / is_pseudo=false
MVVKKMGEDKEIEQHDFGKSVSQTEREAKWSMEKDIICNCGNDVEARVNALFVNADGPSSIDTFILKNASETKIKGDDKLVEGGKEEKTS